MSDTQSILPIFRTTYSNKRSILTLDKKHNGDEGFRSIFQLCQENQVKDVYVIDDNFTGFFEGLANAKNAELNFNFGLRLVITDDATNHTEVSRVNESKIILMIKNNQGYKDLIKIWAWAWEQGSYYYPRISWKHINTMLTPNILVVFPFYDSFIYKNNMTFSQIIPDIQDYGNVITFFKESNELPFDSLISDKIDEFIKSENNPKFIVENVQSIYYEKREDFLAYMSYRCIGEQTVLSKPELQHMSSNTFCFERWKELSSKK